MKHKKRLRKAECRLEYRVALMNSNGDCMVCNKRAGRWGCKCGVGAWKTDRNWKRFRRTQYKFCDVV